MFIFCTYFCVSYFCTAVQKHSELNVITLTCYSSCVSSFLYPFACSNSFFTLFCWEQLPFQILFLPLYPFLYLFSELLCLQLIYGSSLSSVDSSPQFVFPGPYSSFLFKTFIMFCSTICYIYSNIL